MTSNRGDEKTQYLRRGREMLEVTLQSIGDAVIVTDIAGQIITTGHVTSSHRAALGVRGQTITGPDGQPAGVGIAMVTPGGPAAKAGLQTGDVITAVNGTATPDTEALAAVLAGLQPGQQVPVSVTKADGSTATVHVTLGQLPGS